MKPGDARLANCTMTYLPDNSYLTDHVMRKVNVHTILFIIGVVKSEYSDSNGKYDYVYVFDGKNVGRLFSHWLAHQTG